MHVATVHAITVTEQDRNEYKFFAKNIREEIREVADSMIEAAYMDLRLTALSGVKNVVTSLGFRKLRGALCGHATDLLLELEEMKKGGDYERSDEYKAVFKELKELYDFKYMVKADDLAKEFLEVNNVKVRQPLNHKKRYTDFVTVIFRSKLTAQHKNSFLPMFTKYLAVKDGDENEAERVELKCPNGDNKGLDIVYLSKTKSVVSSVKRELFDEKRKSGPLNGGRADAVSGTHAVSDVKDILRRQGEEYFKKLKECNVSNGDDPKINQQVFMELVSATDDEYNNMLVALDNLL
jgi:hypothetical protein